MTTRKIGNINWHRTIILMGLCLFGLSVVFSAKPRRQRVGAKKEDPRVYLEHADELEPLYLHGGQAVIAISLLKRRPEHVIVVAGTSNMLSAVPNHTSST